MTVLGSLFLVCFLVPHSFGISSFFQSVIEIFFELVSKDFAHVIRWNRGYSKSMKLRRVGVM